MGLHVATRPGLGDRAPDIIGATATGRFYSLDAQAGRPAVILPLGRHPDVALRLYEQFHLAHATLSVAGVDLVPLAPSDASLAAALADAPDARDLIIYAASAGGLEALEEDGAPAAVYLDRIGRIVGLTKLTAPEALIAWALDIAARRAAPPARVCVGAAPVLMLPDIASPDFCARLIAHFEASPHGPGLMAGYAQGGAQHKLDETQKHRRDLELTAESPLYDEVLDLLIRRCIPEVKRAFQVDIASADRILIARYDDAGGYFKRHRDNALLHTAFREFAISLNLNTHEYEGGELLFPEYSDDLYSPAAGGAAIFSASLLHEAAPVRKGSRYVLLTFLCSAAGQALAQTQAG